MYQRLSNSTYCGQACILLVINKIALLLRIKEEDELVLLLLSATVLDLILLVDKLPLPRRRTGLSSSLIQIANILVLILLERSIADVGPVLNVLTLLADRLVLLLIANEEDRPDLLLGTGLVFLLGAKVPVPLLLVSL